MINEIKNKLKINFFHVYKNIYIPIKTRKRFELERKLLYRKNFMQNVDYERYPKSILFFTAHKCASSFISKVLSSLAQYSAYHRADFDGYFTLRQKYVSEEIKNKKIANRIFRSHGIIYGPIRNYLEVPDINNYKKLLILRDPRDVLTSLYYSWRYSHPVINKNLYIKRKKALTQNVDEFVIDNMNNFKRIYDEYVTKLLMQPNLNFYKYEDMMRNPKKFIDFISKLIESKPPQNIINEILEDMKPSEKEDLKSHKRSGKSGQYKIKLKKDTIDVLNTKFKDILCSLKY